MLNFQVTETDRLSYVGKNFGPSSSRIQQMCKYYVGIHDKETGKIRICDAEIFNMQPHIPGNRSSHLFLLNENPTIYSKILL